MREQPKSRERFDHSIPKREHSKENAAKAINFVYPAEEDHPFKSRDPRNQYVQNNYRFRDQTDSDLTYPFNKVDPFYVSVYKGDFSGLP
jgi:hypothetical protein